MLSFAGAKRLHFPGHAEEPNPPSQHKSASRTTRITKTICLEVGGFFPLEKVAEFRLTPGSRTMFANLPDFAMRWLVHS